MKRITFIIFCLCAFTQVKAQLAVNDPIAVGQRAALSLESLDEALRQTGELTKQYQQVKQAYDTSKDFYNQYKKVSNIIKGIDAVYQSYETCKQMKYTYELYKNGIKKDKFLSNEEKLSAITSCVLVLEGAISDVKLLQEALKGSQNSSETILLSDGDRITMIRDINNSLKKANYSMQSLYGRVMCISKHRQYSDQVRSLILYGSSKIN